MTSLRHFRWLAVPVILGAAAAVVWFQVQARQAKTLASATKARAAGNPIPVRTASVSDGAVSMVIGATAVTEPSARASLMIGAGRRLAELNPAVAQVHVHNGDYVQTGDALLDLVLDEFELAVAQRQQELVAARADLALAETSLKVNPATRQVEVDAAASDLEFRKVDVHFRKEDHDRIERLRADENASLHEFLEAAAAHAEARFQLSTALLRNRLAQVDTIVGPLRDQLAVDEASGRVRAAVVNLTQAEHDLRNCRLVSPIDGYVDKLSVVAGQSIDPSAVAAEVLQVDPIHVRMDYPQERIGDVAVGQEADVVLDSSPKTTLQGVVARILPHVDVRTRVLPVIIELPNPQGRIRPGVSGFVRLKVSRSATTAPATAVIEQDDRAMVFRVEDGRAHIHPIRTGHLVENGLIEIVDGLAAGDEVVVFGTKTLRDNDPVDTDWRKWTGRE